MTRVTINGVTIDPLMEGPALAAANLEALDATESNYILVQTLRPLNKDMKHALASLGVEILEYVPDDTYLCNYNASDLAAIRALPYVIWTNTYMREFKVAPALITDVAAGPARPRSLLELAAAPNGTLSTTPREVDVVLHANVDPQSVRDKLAAAAQIDVSDLRPTRHKVRLTVAESQLSELASIDEVRHVEAVVPMKLHNNIARGILQVEPPANPSRVFEGRGQTVAVCDTGFDKGSTTDVHEAFTGRVKRLYPLGRSNNANDPNGHGTHVAGSVLGDGASNSLGHTVRGTAPAARLVLQSVLDSGGRLGGLPADLNDLFQTPYEDDDARIHTNSWGSTVGDGSYNSNSFEVDEFVWDHRDCVICFSAGNAGVDRNASGVIDPKSITPPATARNCITVGASENDRPNFDLGYQAAFGAADFPVVPIANDAMANNPEGMVAFSSRGPTSDGRIKPDVVAPGSYILSTRSRDTSSQGWGPSADPLYFFNGGTSMATPLVAGCTALIREYLTEVRQLVNPSAALVKALLINGARDMAGQYVPSEAGGIPNNSEGFGLVDMAATLSELVQVRDEATSLDTGEAESTSVSAGAGAAMKVTLVWTDRPGSTLQNDLDLIVRAADGQERHGNVAPNSPLFDRHNNVEQVVWSDVPAGEVEIIVRAHRIPQFAQTYALVVRLEGGERRLHELEINGPEVQGEINPAGEEDLYTFNVTTAGTYTIDTSGTTDTFLSLFGPDNDSILVASDDDSGPGRLSLLVQDLAVGQYFVQIRHFSPAGRGKYGVAVRSSINPGPVELKVDGPEVLGDIGRPAESDLFTFKVAAAGDFLIETKGSTDTFLALFGPDSESTLITQDDDSGPGLLSRIRVNLVAGTYFVRVRHFSPRETGPYALLVRRV